MHSSARSIKHSSFMIERRFDHDPAQVYRAWVDPAVKARWFKDHVAYTMAKYGMSMCTLGMAEEFRQAGIAVNSLWPRTTIATAAIEINFPDAILKASRKPATMADAVRVILNRDSRGATGNFYIDEAVLREEGVTDFDQYAVTAGTSLYSDLFLE